MKALARMTFAAVALALGSAAALQAQQASIVFLDSERLRQEAPSLQNARTELQQQMQALEQSADSALAPLQAEYQRMIQDFERQASTMAPERRQEQEQAIRAKQMELRQAGGEWEQRAAALQSQILGPALSSVNEVIDQLREERGYAFVLDVAAGGVVAADPGLDITGEVLRRLGAQTDQGS